MPRSEAVRVSRQDAESVRRRLAELEVLRRDLDVAREDDDVLFPVSGCPVGLRTEVYDFAPRKVRPRAYQELLPSELRDAAPRAFEQLGDMCIVKIPKDLREHTATFGAALLEFTGSRVVFHDNGVVGEYRVRDLERIAGEGDSETQVTENQIQLTINPATAYYSPRLATERARVSAMVQSGERVIDLFGGVAPFGLQAALRGAMVETVDLNPEACALARLNVAAAGLQDQVRVLEGDARNVAAKLSPADRLVMNLPHGAHAFLDLVPQLLRPQGILHYHEIMPRADLSERVRELESAFPGRIARVVSTRAVRTYSTEDDHIAFDVELA